jgi:hypothetical protein
MIKMVFYYNDMQEWLPTGSHTNYTVYLGNVLIENPHNGKGFSPGRNIPGNFFTLPETQ